MNGIVPGFTILWMSYFHSYGQIIMVQDWFGYDFPSKYPSGYFCPEKRCLILGPPKSASYIHHAGSTFLHWFSLYHHHCLKSHGETSPLSIPSWDYECQSQGNDSNGSQSFQTLAKNGLPFLRSQTLKVFNGCRQMLGKEWGVCAKAPVFSSMSPRCPVPHIFAQKKKVCEGLHQVVNNGHLLLFWNFFFICICGFMILFNEPVLISWQDQKTHF